MRPRLGSSVVLAQVASDLLTHAVQRLLSAIAALLCSSFVLEVVAGDDAVLFDLAEQCFLRDVRV